MDNPQPLDCVVLGAGPAGLTAALYLRGYQRRLLVLDHGHSRAMSIARTHNYPGFPTGIAGHDLLMRLCQQLAGVDGTVCGDEATALERSPHGGFCVHLGPPRVLATTVLLATGVVDVVPALPGIHDVQRRGLLRQCPICDGHEHRGMRITVIGDGQHAQREALFIAPYSPRVELAGTASVPGAVPGVKVLPAPAVRVETSPAGGVRLHLQNGSTHDCDVLYDAMGVRPRSHLATRLGAERDERGNLLVDADCCSSLPGLYAAGDVVRGLDQLAVATGQGAIAATAIHNSLPQVSAAR